MKVLTVIDKVQYEVKMLLRLGPMSCELIDKPVQCGRLSCSSLYDDDNLSDQREPRRTPHETDATLRYRPPCADPCESCAAVYECAIEMSHLEIHHITSHVTPRNTCHTYKHTSHLEIHHITSLSTCHC